MIFIKRQYKVFILVLIILSIALSYGYFTQSKNVEKTKIELSNTTQQLESVSSELQQKEIEINQYITQIDTLKTEITSLRKETVAKTPGNRNNVVRNTDGSWTATFKVYGYDACIPCCGKTNGITATGTKATAGRTIAVDPNTIPLGSQVIINGNIYIAEDTGGAIKGNKIDMFFNTHQEALQWGVRTLEVTIIPPEV